MTGNELIEFIKNNGLENESLSVEYFSWQKKLKYCGSCQTLVPLKNYHQGYSSAEESSSSYYRYQCKFCISKNASHKKYRKPKC